MQSETHFAASFGEQPVGISQETRSAQTGNATQAKSQAASRSSKMDIVTTAIVIGGTAQFISFIFGLVTEIWPHVLYNVVLSALAGFCFVAIAYVLMKGND